MATNFPTSLDSLTNPTSTDQLTSPSHADQHANANDAIEALQAKVGVNSSAVTTSLDYKVEKILAVSQSNRNALINGAMTVWQRGTTFSSIGGGIYTADRWSTTTTASSTITRDTDTPSYQFRYSLKMAAPSTFSTAEYAMRQWLEVQDLRRFAGKSVTLSFWIKSSKTSLKCRVAAYTSTGGTDTTQSVTVTANTWTKVTFTSTAFSGVTAWSNGDNASGAFFDIGFADNLSYTSSDYVMFTGVQVEEGSVATPFEFEDYGTTLRKCQRYYQKSYNTGTAPATNTNTGMIYSTGCVVSSTSVDPIATLRWSCSMRTDPTVKMYANDGTADQWTVVSTKRSVGVAWIGENGAAPYASGTGFTSGQAVTVYGHYTANAEL